MRLVDGRSPLIFFLALGAGGGCSLVVDGDVLPGEDGGAPDASRGIDGGTRSIAFAGVSSGTGESGFGVDLTVKAPGGTQPGDLLVAAVSANDDETSWLDPSDFGWTLLGKESEAFTPALGVWWRLADDSSDYGFELPGGQTPIAGFGWIMRFTGQAAEPVAATAVFGGDSQAAVCPGVSASAGSLIVCLGSFGGPLTTDQSGLDGFETIIMDGGTEISGGAGFRRELADGDSPDVSFVLDQSLRYRTRALVLVGE